MTKNHIQPHDRFFRSMMSNSKVSREFFQQHLPKDIQQKIDFESLHLQTSSFVDDKLRMQISDLLYQVKFGKSTGYIYLLIEHQTSVDKLMPFRLLKYMVQIMDEHIGQKKHKKLPLIYPMVFYTGNKNYHASMDLFDLFSEPNQAKKCLFGPYQLIDLNNTPDKTLIQFLWAGTMMRTMKHIWKKDLLLFVREVVKEFREIEKTGEMDYIYRTLSYLIEAGEIKDKNEFIKIIQTGLSNKIEEDKIMTLAEQYRRRGVQQGMRMGAKQGSQQKANAIAKALLKKKMATKEIASITGLSQKEVESLN